MLPNLQRVVYSNMKFFKVFLYNKIQAIYTESIKFDQFITLKSKFENFSIGYEGAKKNQYLSSLGWVLYTET